MRIVGTGFTLADLVIFAKDPAIKSLADLKGKQLAIDMGGSQYQVVENLCRGQGHRPRQGHHRGQRQFRRRARAA